MKLPNDPKILYSFINTMLRDGYKSLEAFCDRNGLDKEEIIEKLERAGYRYDEENNRFG